MDYNIDDIKSNWQSISVDTGAFSRASGSVLGALTEHRISSSQEAIVKMLKTEMCIGLALPLLAVALYAVSIPLWVCVVYALFGLVGATAKYWLIRYARQPIAHLPVAEGVRRAVELRRRIIRVNFAIVGPMLAVVGVLLQSLFESSHEGAFWGGIVGFGIGCFVAYVRVRMMLRRTRRLVESLK